MPISLRYIGRGDSRVGIPARDLQDHEVDEFGGLDVLVSTGLYEVITNAPADEGPEKEQVKHVKPSRH
jgi:hypothetical protein